MSNPSTSSNMAKASQLDIHLRNFPTTNVWIIARAPDSSFWGVILGGYATDVVTATNTRDTQFDV